MKKWVTFATVATATAGLLLTGCTPGQNVPGATAAGAVAGGLAGGLLFKGSTAGIVGGALLGGIVGNVIGNQMDARDRANMQQAIVVVPVNQTTTWTNTQTGVTYRVTPVRVYRSSGYPCREYRTQVYVNGRWHTEYGRICRTPNATWRVVNY